MRRWPVLVLAPVLLVALYHLAARDPSGHSTITKYMPLPKPLQHPESVWSSAFGPLPFDPASHHVLIANRPEWHEEVWLWAAGMFAQLGVNHTVFTECDGRNATNSCIRFGLKELSEEVGLWKGDLHPKSGLFAAVNTPLPNGRYADTIFLATEKDDLAWATDQLLDLWHARPAGHKFRVVAVYHEPTGDVEEYAERWGLSGALSFLTLSPHVQTHLENRLRTKAASEEAAWRGIEHIPVRTIVPWFPADEAHLYPGGTAQREAHAVPTRACINGMISPNRRAYGREFQRLQWWLERDASLFGYTKHTNGSYVPDPASPNAPFKLLILGQQDTRYDLPDPGALRAAVEFVHDYDQRALYGIMAGVDVLMLAWDRAYRYLDSQASSSAFTTLETEVPLLITDIIAHSYTFLDSSVSIVRPNALPEMDVIGLFRLFPNATDPAVTVEDLTRAVAHIYLPPYRPEMHAEIAAMLKAGWRRPRAQWRKKKAELERANLDVLRDLLSSPINQWDPDWQGGRG
ncbi:uncharacterized protein LOC62_03G004284 [Vanrija pseudolonga]|uniref:Uncharacterized protein n=1 Tax=Vanrija pseudolonga TaxID=143232 RepID=A0AAF1BQC4_9TREE|nr:hypothetical protein LOC62_03G004284 [Vanrija pseudolonga]